MKSQPTACRARAAGYVLPVALHVLLVLLVLAQVVYLASRYRLRIDLTADQEATTTASTRGLLDRLGSRLVLEAYFSPKEDLPVQWRAAREVADNFLDELVQLGAGKVVLRRFDPNADKDTADKARRLGIEAQDLRSSSATSLSVDLHWQGVRLLLGNGKQEVVSMFVPTSPAMAEALLTPKLKEVMTAKRPRVGFMEWPAPAIGRQQPGGVGWQFVRGLDAVKRRYDLQNFKDVDGALLPDDLDKLVLFRPNELTDRQKYVIDQFLVRGGTLVVFADAAEYAIGPQRLFTSIPLAIDANGSQQQFVRQLEHYGIEWRPLLVADLAPPAMRAASASAPFEYFAVPATTTTGVRTLVGKNYPYFFHACNHDWRDDADELARGVDGKVDAALAAQYREAFAPGMPADDFLFRAYKKIDRGPGFYWPTSVGLRHRAGGKLDLPSGVEGRVLLWSSPLSLVETAPQRVDPIGRDPLQYSHEYERFLRSMAERLAAAQRVQVPLMAEVRGRFVSYFAGMERPLRPSEAAAVKPGEAAPSPGVPPPDAPQPTVIAEERAMLVEGERAGRVIIVGDSTFLRDDVIRGDYAQVGGPVSGNIGSTFFANLLDWISDDADLVELQSHAPTDRKLTLLDARSGRSADPLEVEQRLRSKTAVLVAVNVVAPCGALLLAGLVVWFVRRNQKREFLLSLDRVTRAAEVAR
ncbi:MAG: GldG family protein [Planctomycetes bacterium]|nr:GldG family protein [Planctomycetota bacterium]